MCVGHTQCVCYVFCLRCSVYYPTYKNGKKAVQKSLGFPSLGGIYKLYCSLLRYMLHSKDKGDRPDSKLPYASGVFLQSCSYRTIITECINLSILIAHTTQTEPYMYHVRATVSLRHGGSETNWVY